MSAVAGQLCLPLLSCNSEQEDPKTSSSILDFLNQERKCLWSANPDGASDELTIDGIFDEINRLSGKIHESKSVDEILQEAETLILSQAPIQLKCSGQEWPPPFSICGDGDEQGMKDQQELLRRVKESRPKEQTIVPHSKSESQLSKQLPVDLELASIVATMSPPPPSATPSAAALAFDDIPLDIIHHPQPASMSSSIYSPTNSYARERALESEITSLQDKLKDTEERYHALRIKYDSLRVQYRDIKGQHTGTQDESEKLRLDVKHLNDCASILRNEIHVARDDRAEATRLKAVLQSELNGCRVERKRLVEQTDRDSRTILDLQRQCKEMEKILSRKHPDSVSALIVAAKQNSSDHGGREEGAAAAASRKLLEQRIVQLEQDAVEQDAKAQKILGNVQTKFSAIQAKYETHIADLETQVLSLQEINTTLNKKIVSLADSMEQLQIKERESTSQSSRAESVAKTSRSTQTVTPAGKVSSLPRATMTTSGNNKSQTVPDNDSAHLMATIRGMRVDLAIKEKALQRLTRELDECKKTIRKLKEMSCKIPVGSGHKKPYDPLQFTEKVESGALKEAHHKLKLLEFDYKALHDKRLQDLKTLQAAHERELSSCQETVRILQQRLAEGDEAQKSRRRVPVDYHALKAKVTNLEQRHSEREDRLHMLVEALSKGRLNGIIDEALHSNNNNSNKINVRSDLDNGSESTVSPNSD